jgi:hypothetical protein
MIQLGCEPRAPELRDQALLGGHSRRAGMRILKRHLSNVIYRTVLRDGRFQARAGSCDIAPPATGAKDGRRPRAGLGLDSPRTAPSHRGRPDREPEAVEKPGTCSTLW